MSAAPRALLLLVLAACSGSPPPPPEPPDPPASEVDLTPTAPPLRMRRAARLGPSKARPLEPEVAEALRAEIAVLPPPTTLREAGRLDALNTILSGRLVTWTMGLPSPCAAEFERALLAQYAIESVRVAGCIIEPAVSERAAGYNAVMDAEIARRYGPGVFAELALRVCF